MIPTIDELIKKHFGSDYHELESDVSPAAIEKLVIEATTLHTQEALKQANKKAKIYEGRIKNSFTEGSRAIITIDENSILNAYPLENIK